MSISNRTCENGVHVIGYRADAYEQGSYEVESSDDTPLNPEYDDIFSFCPHCGMKLQPIARDAASAPGARSSTHPGGAGSPEGTRGDRSQPA